MKLDSQEQKRLLLELIRVAQFSGEVIELAVATKRAVEAASIADCDDGNGAQVGG